MEEGVSLEYQLPNLYVAQECLYEKLLDTTITFCSTIHLIYLI